MLASQALQPPIVADVAEQLEFQVLNQSSSLKLQLEQAKHHPLADADKLLEMQKHQLIQETDQAISEDLDSHLAGNISFD